MKAYKIVVIAAVAMILAMTVQAEIVIDQKMSINTMGMQQEVSTISYFGVDKSRTEMDAQGGYAAAMGGGKTISITRLDKGVVWTLFPGMKKYSEMQLSEMAKMMEQSIEQQEGDAEKSGLTWKTEVEKLGKKTINGLDAEGIKATVYGTDPEDAENNITLIFEEWFASTYDGSEELNAFMNKMGESFGFNPLRQNDMLSAMTAQVGYDMDEIAAAMKDMEGIPVKLVMTTKKAVPAMDEEGMDEETAAMMKKMMGDKGADGQQVLFSFDMEITGITASSDVSPDYEIPEGYTKGM